MSEVLELLNIQKASFVSVIGAGGKTSLINHAATCAPSMFRVIITTTTHIARPDGMPIVNGNSRTEIIETLAKHRIITVANKAKEEGKLCKPACPMCELLSCGALVLCEADGAHHRPLKAHNPESEPVIPKESTHTVLVVGAHGFGKSIEEAVHRPEIFCKTLGTSPSTIVTPSLYARFIKAEIAFGIYTPTHIVVVCGELNKAREAASEMQQALPSNFEAPIIYGSLATYTFDKLR